MTSVVQCENANASFRKAFVGLLKKLNWKPGEIVITSMKPESAIHNLETTKIVVTNDLLFDREPKHNLSASHVRN